MTEATIFAAALDKATDEERAAYLAEACGGDDQLRHRVEALLRAHAAPGALFDPASALDFTADYAPLTERPGTRIGPYRLLEQIGEGGFGVVFMAEQHEPIRRKVALKILKPGMDTRQVVARFEAERQALAIMDHPSIAKVFDGGQTASGRPYFVMELVKGAPLTEFCDHNQLSPRQRLDLLVSVCQAVQHAHQKGIIHRDLKPSNVLVMLHDTTPVVKVIDFGVAKALGQELTDKTLFTGFAQMIGTPLYMSPEQAGRSGLDIDTRSDIYSLGVLLYELLTGTTPFEKERLRTAGYDEIRRIIREEEPPRPSTRISTLGQAATTASTNRKSDPKQLSRLFRGELDWIVMKALEKDRNRRYETASALAADVQRYLNDEPVLACPPSAWYRLRKFVRRNKASLLTASVLTLAALLAVGSIGWIVQDRAARKDRTTHEVEQFLERSHGLYHDGKLPEALTEIEKAHGLAQTGGCSADVQRQLQSWRFELVLATRLEELRLQWFDHADRGRSATDYAKAFRDYEIDVETLPSAEASRRVAESRINADLVSALDDWILRLQGDSRAEVIARRQQLQGIVQAADPDPWRQRFRKASAEKDVRTLREMAASADVTRMHVRSLVALGSALRAAGDAQAAVVFLRRVQEQYPGDFNANFMLVLCQNALWPIIKEEAISYARVVVALRPTSPMARLQLAHALAKVEGHTDDAMRDFREAIRLKPNYGNAHMMLGDLLLRQKRDRVEAFAEYARAIDSEPAIAHFWSARGASYLSLGQTDNAFADYIRAIQVQPDDPSGWRGRAAVYLIRGQYNESIADLDRAIKLEPGFAPAWYGRGDAYLRLGQKVKALEDISHAIELMPDYRAARQKRSDLFLQLGKSDKAIEDLSYLLQREPNNGQLRRSRAQAYHRLSQWDEAIADFSKLIALDPKAVDAWHSRGQVYRRLAQKEKAVADFSEALKLDPRSTRTLCERGWMLAELGRWNEAAADLGKAVTLQPERPTIWYQQAMALLGTGDRHGYRKVCAGMQAQFKKTRDPETASHVVSTCVTAPEGVTDPAQLLAFAELAASTQGHWNTRFLGATFYRMNQSERALRCFQEKAKAHEPRAWDLLFQAMAHHRLGHGEDARRHLSQAEDWLAIVGPPARPGVTSAREPRWFNWQEEIAVRVLRKEAEDRIKERSQKVHRPKDS